PALATGVHPNGDNTEWTVKIRPGVTFHNGEPLTAQAVAASVRHQADPKTVGMYSLRVNFIDSVKATDAATVVFTLKEPYAQFQQILADPFSLIVPPSAFASGKAKPIGTGPWQLASFEPGSKVTVRRNPKYWRAGRPYIDTVEVTVIPDAATREQALVAGEIDLMFWIPVDSVPRLKAQQGIAVHTA